MDRFDLVVVGAGIVGLAHAWMGARRGWRVAVVERDHRCIGASIRNFGFVTVTGQRQGDTWRRARRSAGLWSEAAEAARIPVLQRGLWVAAQRPAAAEVLRAFQSTEMGQACELLGPAEVAARAPLLRAPAGALYSPHELRVESRDALPRLVSWLSEVHGVRFFNGEAVLGVEPGRVHTARRSVQAERIALCPGTDLTGPASAWLPPTLRLSRLQMMRLRPTAAVRLPTPVMGDLSLVRYAGYAELPESQALHQQLLRECPDSLAHGIHLIAVQSADGSLVVGDSHHEHLSPEPFGSEAVDQLILEHLHESIHLPRCEVVERWTGVYPTGHTHDALVEAPDPGLRVVLVTSGTGASTAFGLAEEVIQGW
ncbi:TIGR03364 family FAD-dependent oxidoreductase [Roseateles amylovorans]|uniref:TIGR03364 family FAD-dependent oxidoreductase n=1 Tax=Roseateles amylovorans TaxID=2978473 RepID=A0ABY6BAE4_9BURK|nr:TIGR03364 family FAD-dependent oxidoreductase [Roseateles amylovorans]UXH80888.1 TIGR03364 family FAD-dependent oxidoreductase [Roseateles amylovorans]